MSAFNVLGNRFDSQNVYVIGDTPKDIEGARDCGYVSVAVATGHYSFEELAREISDYVLPDLREFPRILR
jgi:phosphoglycolate phosphatase-like HAD superfamily hydrolase